MSERGFTLIEALVVLAIAAVVLAIGAPNLSHLIGSINARSAAFDLIGDLALARSEAIKRNTEVTVEPVDGDWAQGWRVVANGATLRQRERLPAALSVATGFIGNVSFRPNGRLSADESATDKAGAANATWAITSTNATPRCVVITPTGAARSKVGTCS